MNRLMLVFVAAAMTGCIGATQAGTPPPGGAGRSECRMGSDGQQYCGYNCRMGSNGQFYCASRPDGQCALNSDGTFTCP